MLHYSLCDYVVQLLDVTVAVVELNRAHELDLHREKHRKNSSWIVRTSLTSVRYTDDDEAHSKNKGA